MLKTTTQMNKYFLLFLCLIANSSFVQSQEKLINQQQDSINFNDKIYKTIYQIKLSSSPLTIELIEKLDGDFFGTVNIVIDRDFENKSELFVGKMQIEKSKVEKLISEFKKIALETVKNCTENDDCVMGLDGVHTEFNIKSNNVIKEYSFWELTPNQKNEKDTPENRKKAQKVLDFLDKELNLKVKYRELLQKLPKGRYSYWIGNGDAIFTKK
ncbi:hypothetical protein [Flavobacterium sp. LB3P21]|uniref:hypothetical protein n=1 Tax=unclassified Flavobacterium TaxID=196869 RepID=UPI003AAAB7C6